MREKTLSQRSSTDIYKWKHVETVVVGEKWEGVVRRRSSADVKPLDLLSHLWEDGDRAERLMAATVCVCVRDEGPAVPCG